MESNRRQFLTAGASAIGGAAALEAQNQKPIRVAVIGTGTRAWAHLAILNTMPGYQVVVMADPTPENMDRAATITPGAARYTDYKKMLAERKDIDAVVVITPSFLHAEVAVAAFERGLPVLTEKPIATTVEDANRMIAASKKAGKPLYVGFQKRLVPATARMKELVAAGEIGKLLFVSGNLFRGDWNPKSWKYTDPKTGVKTNWRYLTHTEGSALLEDGVHEIDSLNWMVNEPVVRVQASGGNNVFKDRETADHVATIIEYASGVKISFELCLFGSHAGPQSRRLVLIGSEGVMYPENGKLAVRKGGREARYVEVTDNTPKAATAKQVGSAQDPETYRQYQQFDQVLRAGKAPFVSPESAKTTMKIILLAEKSWRERRVLNWNDLPA